VSDFDAYEDDMRWLFAPDDREIDRLLESETLADDERLDDLSAFLAELKDAYLEPVDEGIEIRHLAAIGGALRSAASEAPVEQRARRNRRSTRMGSGYGRAVARFAAAAVLAFAALAGGLAVAGVDIPVLPDQAADQAKEAVAEHAAGAPQEGGRPDEIPPDAARTPEFLETLRAAIADTPPEERGCEFGQAIATIASGSDPTEDDPCAKGENRANGNGGNGQPGGGGAGQPQGSKATGEQASGGIAADPPSAGSKAIGDQASGGIAADPPSAGSKATGDQASGGVSADAGPPSTGSGAGGQQIGQDAAAGAGQQAPVTTPAPAGNRP
jgi:hypothetical protein